jgi:hypothetical protein
MIEQVDGISEYGEFIALDVNFDKVEAVQMLRGNEG